MPKLPKTAKIETQNLETQRKGGSGGKYVQCLCMLIASNFSLSAMLGNFKQLPKMPKVPKIAKIETQNLETQRKGGSGGK
jgi:hypothetical protein